MLILCSTINLVSILSRSLPTAPGYWTEEGFEAIHKLERFRRLHHARKNNVGQNMGDIVKLQFCAAHPSILCHIKKYLVPKRRKNTSPQPEDESIEDLLVSPPASKDVEAELEKPEPTQAESSDSDEEFDYGDVELDELKALESDSESDIESDESDIEFVVEEEESEEEEEEEF